MVMSDGQYSHVRGNQVVINLNREYLFSYYALMNGYITY